jgi:hypothetical protein
MFEFSPVYKYRNEIEPQDLFGKDDQNPLALPS